MKSNDIKRIVLFQVLAKETISTEKFTGNASVTIYLNNVNDNPPIFNQSVYNFNVYENTEIGKVVGVVRVNIYCNEWCSTSLI